jgi:phosphoribosylamine--glycine ligase
MKILILGNGGREHALCHYMALSPKVSEIFCIPGNAGTEIIAKNFDLDLNDFQNLKKFIIKNKINIVLVGPEKPLVNGITDYLEKYNIKVFGPNKIASKLEGSKIFTKKLCKKYNIPTAKFHIFQNSNKIKKFLLNCNYPVVIKADGLASGKGVYICKEKIEAELAIKEIFNGKFGKAKNVLLEEFLEGEEMSFFILSDGKSFKCFGTAQDHKKVGENDTGPNTGGMGAYSPSRLENKLLNKKILEKIIKPTLNALKDINSEFKGFLYAGLMIYENEPYLIEYNVRMGDPECQTILPRLNTDFFDIIKATIDKKLNTINIKWKKQSCLSIVLCSKGYPNKFINEVEIHKLKNIRLKKNQFIFHAGTKLQKSKIISNGGRVLNFVVNSLNLKESRDQALKLIKKLNWKNGFFRKDIGYKIIDQ